MSLERCCPCVFRNVVWKFRVQQPRSRCVYQRTTCCADTGTGADLHRVTLVTWLRGDVVSQAKPPGSLPGPAQVGGVAEISTKGWASPLEEGRNSEAVSCGISAERDESTEQWATDSEKDYGLPHKHLPRHARFRRSVSQLEKQAKKARYKCRCIALLLTAAPNSNNSKGVLLFKKHRQLSKKYTLVSYGTVQEEPRDEGEVKEEDFLAADDQVWFADVPNESAAVNKDTEKTTREEEEMDQLPETMGKGAMMFARRRQRVDEIAAEHEEMRRKGIPVDSNIQESKPQVQQLPPSVNGVVPHPQSLVSNRTPKPFLGVTNRIPAAFSTSEKFRMVPPPAPVSMRPQVLSPTDQEQIVSRDERIAVPAIRTVTLQDTKKRKPEVGRVTSREFPAAAAEEDYLSLGAEACNFLQAPTVKHKTPPPVAPKPAINLASWAVENAEQTPFCPQPSEVPAPAQVQQDTPLSTWAPPAQHPVSSWAPGQTRPQPLQPASARAWAPQPPWMQPRPAPSAHVGIYAPRASLTSSDIGRAASPASDMPTMRGRGAELFARRQTRMEKFVVDADTVQANKARAQSPTPSLPSAWKYSPNVRAPPPLSYNPLLTPSYPLAASKQPVPSTKATRSEKTAPKPKEKGKQGPKPLNALEVMQHQPYQLDASLFTYGPPAQQPKAPSPVPTPTTQPAKPSGVVSSRQPFSRPPPPKSLRTSKTLPLSPALHDGPAHHSSPPLPAPPPTAPKPRLATIFPKPSIPQPASSSIKIGAPRPKFSAKKPVVLSKSWKPVIMGHVG